MIRVLIVDDEAPARSRLRQMLAAHADVEVAGEAETGVQAMQLTIFYFMPNLPSTQTNYCRDFAHC